MWHRHAYFQDFQNKSGNFNLSSVANGQAMEETSLLFYYLGFLNGATKVFFCQATEATFKQLGVLNSTQIRYRKLLRKYI